MTLIPERFLRFAIRDLKAEIEHDKNIIGHGGTGEKEFWLSRLNEYYAINHGDLEENAKIDEARIRDKLVKSAKRMMQDVGLL